MKTYLRLSTNQWAWGASAHWRLYYSLKTFGKKFTSYTNAAQDIHRREKKDFRRPQSTYQSKRFRHTSTPDHFSIFPDTDEPLLTDDEVNNIIETNECSIDLQCVDGDYDHNAAKCEINQLGSNEPNEDQVFVTKSECEDGILFGVLDGHGGAMFGEYIKKRLPYYVHSSLAKNADGLKSLNFVENLANKPIENLNTFENEFWGKSLKSFIQELLPSINEGSVSPSEGVTSQLKTPLKQLFGSNFVDDSHQVSTDFNFEYAVKEAFARLDNDMIEELLHLANNDELSKANIGLGTSGCCALIAYLLGNELYIANLGDCRAVLGSFIDGSWTSTQLTHDHTSAANLSEVQRILGEHPAEESRTCLSYGRLLGRLAPLRALGDFQFKLPNDDLEGIFKFLPKYTPFSTSLTPPYLSAEPEVFHYKLEPSDRFIVLASDGLWDMLGNDEVVQLVGSFIEQQQKINNNDELLRTSDSDKDPEQEKNTLKGNSASYLIRQALGGYDKNSLKDMLSMKYPDVRMYRDDISIIVVFFNEDGSQDVVDLL